MLVVLPKVSGQSTGPIFKDQGSSSPARYLKKETDRLYRNIGKKSPAWQRNIAEHRKPLLHHGGSHISRKIKKYIFLVGDKN
jgi:hypothetical protein